MQIRSRLFIIMISLVTSAIIVPSIIALNTFTRSLETEITEELKISALSAMDKLSRLMFERLADLRFLTYPGNTMISSSDDNITLEEKVEYLRQIEKANKAYASISLYNASGIKIGDTRSIDIGANDSREPFYKNAINGTYYYDSVPTYSRSLGQYVVHFSGPLHDLGDNQIDGVLVLKFPLNKINEIMVEAGGTISSDVNIELVSDDGLLIYSNNDRKAILQKEVTGLKIFDKLQNSTNRVESEIVAGATGGEPMNTIFIGSKDPGFLDYRGNNWSLILGINTQDAFKNISLLSAQFIIVAAIILSISTFLVFIFAKSISRPIIKLRDVTNEVSKGNLGIKVDLQKSGGNELKQLSSSFENMRQTILARTEEVLRVNEELKLKDRLKDEFINVAAHELRTPIQPILGLCEVLRSKIRKGSTSNPRSEEEQLLDIIIKNAKRLRGLAQEILDVTRIESKGFDLNLETFDLVSLLSNIVTDTREQISKLERDINITFELEGKLTSGTGVILVNADKDKITQVISNLLGNAVKFTKDGIISVKVSTNKESGEAIICIKDTGQGIDPSIVPHLFTKFSSKSFEGIGLGLFIAKNIVQAHGGRIWAENNSDGKGAVFFFTLRIIHS
ncbi:MAG: HAMP domain-containing protein [Nitrososphaeraceae archaeon]|nr:HAMP domain-containing protein [Nitrososphaeraceae archaeon]